MSKKQRGENYNRRLWRFSAILLMVVVCLLSSIPSVSALEFDNVDSYDSNTRTTTITNAFGLGKVIGQAQLITPQNNKVGLGYQMIAEFDLWAYEDYNDVIKSLTLYDRNKKDWKNNKINRNVDIKYKTYQDVKVYDYKDVVIGYSDDGTELVRQEKDGFHYDNKEVWVKVTPADLKKNEKLRIGIFLGVEDGDYGEWILDLFGVKQDQWATWTADLNTNLVAYYSFDIDARDSLGVHNGSLVDAPTNAAGKVGNAYTFDGTNDDITVPTHVDFDIGTGDFSINSWYKSSTAGMVFSTQGLDPYAGISLDMAGTGIYVRLAGGSGTQLSTYNSSIDEWMMITLNREGTNVSLWINGVYNGSAVSSADLDTATALTFATLLWSPGVFYDGSRDEFGIWKGTAISQAQITQLYNESYGISYSSDLDSDPTATLISPANATSYTTSPQSIDFTCYGADDFNLTSMEFYLNEVLTQTNSSGLNNTNYTFTESLTDEYYNWSCTATDNDSQQTESETWFVNIDGTLPVITIEAPTGNIDYGTAGRSENLNVTINDTNLDTCWYNYNGTNITIDGCVSGIKNLTTFLIEADNTNITIYANDTLGNEKAAYTSWTYYIFEISQSYESEVIEGSTSLFSTNLTLIPTLRLSTANLIYNGTSYSAITNEYTTDKYYIYKTLNIPSVSTDTNVSFYWNLTFEDLSSSVTASNNQTIYNLVIDNCSTGTFPIFNLSMVDEADQGLLDAAVQNTSIKVDMSLSYVDGSAEVINYSYDFDEVNPAAVCSNVAVGDSTFILDAVIQYSSAARFIEFYNIQDYDFTNSTSSQNITLYNLKESEGQEFKITYKGTDFVPVADLLIQIHRKYVDEGEFKVIEIPMSGSNGYTIAHLVNNDVIYNLIFIKDGVILDTFLEVIPSCQNPTITECEINLNALITGANMLDIITEGDFFASLDYDKDTRVVSSLFGLVSGVSGLVSLNVSMFDNFGNRTACYDSLNAAGGLLSCVVPDAFGNSTIYAKVVYNDIIRREGFISLNDTPKDQYGGILVFASLILVMFILGIGLNDSPAITGIFLILGALLLVGLNLVYSTSIVGAGATILWFIAAVIVVIIKGSEKR